MTFNEKAQKARSLYNEHRKEYQFYSKARQRGFCRRCHNLFKHIDPNNSNDLVACMFLDAIATRVGFEYDR